MAITKILSKNERRLICTSADIYSNVKNVYFFTDLLQ
jgi:hypothetical protein